MPVVPSLPVNESQYARGGVVTNVGSTYFHEYTYANFEAGAQIHRTFNVKLSNGLTNDFIPVVKYVVVDGGYPGVSGSVSATYGGAGGSYINGSEVLVGPGQEITITMVGVGGDPYNMRGITSITKAATVYYSITSGGVGGVPVGGGMFNPNVNGGDGYLIPGYGYVASGGGGGSSVVGTAGGLGGGEANGIRCGGQGGGSNGSGQNANGIGGGGGGSGIENAGVGNGGNGGVIIYYTIGGGSVCFLEGTPVETDQGEVAIDKLDTQVNTINGKRILAVTKTPGEKDCLLLIKKDLLGENMPNKDTVITRWHEVLFEGDMEEAQRIPDVSLYPYNGEILYNVLLDEHETMKINGLTVETLDPDHKVAKYYRSLLN